MIVVVLVLGAATVLFAIAVVSDALRALRHLAPGRDPVRMVERWPLMLDINNFTESGHVYWRRAMNSLVMAFLLGTLTGMTAILTGAGQ